MNAGRSLRYRDTHGARRSRLIAILAVAIVGSTGCEQAHRPSDAGAQEAGADDGLDLVAADIVNADLIGPMNHRDGGPSEAALLAPCAAAGFCRQDGDCPVDQRCADCEASWCVQCGGLFKRCVPRAPCADSSDCVPFGFCVLGALGKVDGCPSAADPGRCVPLRPTSAQCHEDTVCGCDGFTYYACLVQSDIWTTGDCSGQKYSCDELLAGFDAKAAGPQPCSDDADCRAVSFCGCGYVMSRHGSGTPYYRFTMTFDNDARCECPQRSCPPRPKELCVAGSCQ